MDGADLAQPYGVRLRRVQELQAYVESSHHHESQGAEPFLAFDSLFPNLRVLIQLEYLQPIDVRHRDPVARDMQRVDNTHCQ